jgi:hypothetical protein
MIPIDQAFPPAKDEAQDSGAAKLEQTSRRLSLEVVE